MAKDTRARALEELAAVLVHEFRNPLASIHGCARTLLDSEPRLTPDVRRSLLGVVVEQSRRLDWLIRAAGAAVGGNADRRVVVDAVAVVARAADALGISVPSPPGRSFVIAADADLLMLGVQALALALQAEQVSMFWAADVLVITSDAVQVDAEERRWKASLGEQILTEQGFGVTIQSDPRGTTVSVSFDVDGVPDEQRVS